jgi:hypothetical protein
MFYDDIINTTGITEGLSRELYSLIGGAPPIAFIKPNYKAKLSFQQKAVPWYVKTYIMVLITSQS